MMFRNRYDTIQVRRLKSTPLEMHFAAPFPARDKLRRGRSSSLLPRRLAEDLWKRTLPRIGADAELSATGNEPN
jgi:hypothetical protein